MKLLSDSLQNLLSQLLPYQKRLVCLLMLWGAANTAIFYYASRSNPDPFLKRLLEWNVIAYVVVLAICMGFLVFIVVMKRKEKEELAEQTRERYDQLDLTPKVNPSARLPVPKEIHDAVTQMALETNQGPRGYSDPPPAAGTPRLICVVSGKGGVGKSVIALGLLERLCCERDTLLVDFDLHNRGLTSLLANHAQNGDGQDHSLSLLENFLRITESKKDFDKVLKRAFKDESASLDKNGFEPFQFKQQLRAVVGEFAGRELLDAQRMRLKTLRFPKNLIEVPWIKGPVPPSRAHFLSSMASGTNFMESPAFEAKTSEVFVFLYCLMVRAVHCNLFPYIIVDCHGAHDTFTAGAICAATDIVIVTTPDIGSLDGTKQLLEYSLRLRQTYARRRFRSKLVINRCFEGEPDVARLAETWHNHVTDEPIRIERRDSIERLSRTYQFGAIANDRYLWERIEEISQMSFREDKPLADSASAPGAASAPSAANAELAGKTAIAAIPEAVA